MEYGVNGRFSGHQDSFILQRQCNIQVVGLKDAYHLTGVEDSNRILPRDVIAIGQLLRQWKIC